MRMQYKRRPAAMGDRERAGGGKGRQSRLLAGAPQGCKADRPQTDERLWKSDAVAKETAILAERAVRRKNLPPEIKISLLIGDQKDRERKRTGESPGFDLNLKREAEIGRLFEHRYGGESYMLPDDDAGRDDALLMVHHQVKLAHGRARAWNWLAMCCPWMNGDEAKHIIARACAQDWSFEADRLAERLGLTFDLRNGLEITTIGSVDVGKAGRKKVRGAKDRKYQAAKRLASGATPRKLSISQLEPWINRPEPMSRPEWYRLPEVQRNQEVEALRQFRRQQDTEYPLGADEFVSAGNTLAPTPNSPILSTREEIGVIDPGRALERAPAQTAERDIDQRERDIPPDFRDIERHSAQGSGLNPDPRYSAIIVTVQRAPPHMRLRIVATAITIKTTEAQHHVQ